MHENRETSVLAALSSPAQEGEKPKLGMEMGGARHGNGWLAPKDEKCAVPGGNCHMGH